MDGLKISSESLETIGDSELIQPEEVSVSDAVTVEAVQVRSPLGEYRCSGVHVCRVVAGLITLGSNVSLCTHEGHHWGWRPGGRCRTKLGRLV